MAEATLHPDRFLAMDSGLTTGKVAGINTKEPAFGTPAVWIEPTDRDQAEMLGYTVVEPVSVLATHLTEAVRKHADEILTRDAAKHLVDQLKQTSPAVVEELIPSANEAGRSAADSANAAARAGADPSVGPDSGNPGRLAWPARAIPCC